MHTPDGPLQEDVGTETDSAAIHTQPSQRSDLVLGHVMSLPLKDNCENLSESVLRIQSQLGNLAVQKSTSEPVSNVPHQDSSPDTPQPQYDLNKGWMVGFFSCLRPVLSIIGKGSLYEIKHGQDDWEISFDQITDLHYLGYGGQGVVFSGMLNNQPVAVKKVKDIKETDIKNLRKLNHPNIVKFKCVCTEEPWYSIVMEFCPYGPLFNLLKNQKNVVTITRVVSWAKQITNGMQYLHSQKIIHRDLKSPNVLIGENEVIKISDFGTSRTFNGVSEKMSFAGTVAWMAPEAIQELECSEKVDIWAFGVVLWELLTCEIPYDGMEQSAIMYLVGVGKLKPPIPKTCPDGFKLIMEMCWKMNPKERPSFKLILNHLQIASVEILGKYNGDQQYFKTQESWREEIKSQITEFKTHLHQRRVEFKLQDEYLINQRESELKQIKDIREMYDRKLERVNQLYLELAGVLQQVEQYRQGGRKRRLLNPFMRKIERRRGNHSSTPTSPEHSLTSPDSPQKVPAKAPLYVQLKAGTEKAESVTQTTQTSGKLRKKQYRTSTGGSPRSSACSRTSSCRSSAVDAETQTNYMDISENDSSSVSRSSTSETLKRGAQKVILRELRPEVSDDEDEETLNGNNAVQFQYMSQESGVVVLTRRDSGAPSLYENALNSNDTMPKGFSDEDNLEVIGNKFSALKNGNILCDVRLSTENGNIPSDLLDSSHHPCNGQESTEDACSFTDEEGEVYTNTLRRRSMARRPIYPGRRSSRFKAPPVRKQIVSDEGDTSEYYSEYSVSAPSSKCSTLESNPDTVRTPCPLSAKRPIDGSTTNCFSDTDSENNITVVTQVA